MITVYGLPHGPLFTSSGSSVQHYTLLLLIVLYNASLASFLIISSSLCFSLFLARLFFSLLENTLCGLLPCFLSTTTKVNASLWNLNEVMLHHNLRRFLISTSASSFALFPIMCPLSFSSRNSIDFNMFAIQLREFLFFRTDFSLLCLSEASTQEMIHLALRLKRSLTPRYSHYLRNLH